MATGNQQQATSLAPLKEELANVDWLRQVLGTGSGAGNAAASAPQVGDVSAEQLAALMQQFTRQSGLTNILAAPRQSGLYNASTQRLLANDLMSQAAAKAAMANVDVQKTNAELKLQAMRNAGNADSKTTKQKRTDLALALAMAAANSPKGTMAGIGDSIGSVWDNMFGGGDAAAANMFSNPLSDVTAETPSYDFDLAGFDNATSTVDTSYLDYADASMGGDVVDVSDWGTEDLDWSEIFTDA